MHQRIAQQSGQLRSGVFAGQVSERNGLCLDFLEGLVGDSFGSCLWCVAGDTAHRVIQGTTLVDPGWVGPEAGRFIGLAQGNQIVGQHVDRLGLLGLAHPVQQVGHRGSRFGLVRTGEPAPHPGGRSFQRIGTQDWGAFGRGPVRDGGRGCQTLVAMAGGALQFADQKSAAVHRGGVDSRLDSGRGLECGGG